MCRSCEDMLHVDKEEPEWQVWSSFPRTCVSLKTQRGFRSDLWSGSWWACSHLSSYTPVNHLLLLASSGVETVSAQGWKWRAELEHKEYYQWNVNDTERKKQTQQRMISWHRSEEFLLCVRSCLSDAVLLSSFSCLRSRTHSCSLASSNSCKCFVYVCINIHFRFVTYKGCTKQHKVSRPVRLSCSLRSPSWYLWLCTGRARDGLTELLLQRAQLLLLLAALATQLTLQKPGTHISQQQTPKPHPLEMWMKEETHLLATRTAS